jgi:hypothetical protein
MLRRLRENGPALLVPLAWTFAATAHLGIVSARTVLIAHVVMAVLLFGFAALSWSEMREGVLLAWRRVVVLGFGLTLLGVAGLVAEPDLTFALFVTVVGWMLLPAAGFVYTARRVETRGGVYRAGALLSALGAAAYAVAVLQFAPAWALVGLALVGVGQTAGIVVAVVE